MMRDLVMKVTSTLLDNATICEILDVCFVFLIKLNLDICFNKIILIECKNIA